MKSINKIHILFVFYSVSQKPILKYNQWNHLCISYESENNLITLYINVKEIY